MKKSMLEKQLKKEIEAASPSDFSAVMARCDTSLQTEKEAELVGAGAGGETVRAPRSKVRLTALLLAGVLLVSCFFVCLFGGLNGLFSKKAPFKQGYFVLDINPSVEVRYDEEGTVTSAVGLNDDGKALLVGLDLKEKSYQTAADILFERCVAMGYFARGREDNAVLITALSDEGEKDAKMTSEVKSALRKGFTENKMRGVVITGVGDAALETEAQTYGINAQKYGLILSYLALGGELEEEKYATVSVRELYALIAQEEQILKQAKIAENELVLEKFERELHETLSEQIEGLISTMGVYLSEEGSTQKDNLQALETQADALEHAQSQKERKKIIDEILRLLDSLKEGESDSTVLTMIESAKISVTVTYDFFERAFVLLKKESATPEEISAVRLWKFATYGDEAEDGDFEEWQEAHERAVSEKWYEQREAWRNARRQDF